MPTRLYLITPPRLELQHFAASFKAALDAADVACVQLRLKDAHDDDWKRAVDALMPLAHARDIAFVLNDRADLAAKLGCDGVHIGQDDTPYINARKLLGPDRIVGVSCYASRDRAMFAAEEGADYVAFGSVFPSPTKDMAPPVPMAVLADWAAMTTTPCVAIGGITAANCAPLVAAGVDFLAVISAVWDYAGGAGAGAAALQKAIEMAEKNA